MTTAFERLQAAEPMQWEAAEDDGAVELRFSAALRRPHDPRLETAVAELPRPPRLENSANFPSRMSFLLSARLRAMPFPFAVMLIVTGSALIWTTVALPFQVSLGGSPVWVWGAWLCASFSNYFAFIWLSSIIVEFIGLRNYSHIKIDYYTRDIAVPAGVVLASLVEFGVNTLFLIGPATSRVIRNVYAFSGSVLAFSLAALLVQICTRISLAKIDPNSFWYRLSILVWKRRSFRVFLATLRRSLYNQVQSIRVSEMDTEKLNVSPLDKLLDGEDTAAFVGNESVISFGSEDLFTRYLCRDITLHTEISGNSVDALIVSGGQVARYDQNLVRVAVRVALVLYRRLSKRLDDIITPEEVASLPWNGVDSRDIFRILRKSKSDNVIEFVSLVENSCCVLRDQEALQNQLKGTGSGGSVLRAIWSIVWFFVALFVVFGIYGLEFSALLAPVLSFALAFTFIFGTSVQRIWNAFIEVVVSRRFRVGDWVQFVGYSGFEVDYIDMLEVTGLDATGNRVSVPTFNLWGLELQNSNRSGFFRIRMYVQIGAETPNSTITKVGRDIMNWVRQRATSFQPHTFEFWSVADQMNNQWLGWSQLFDLRVKTICLQVNMEKLLQAQWTETRDAQTQFHEAVRKAFMDNKVVVRSVLDNNQGSHPAV